MNDTIVRNIFLAFIRVHVLYHAIEGRIYGLEMIDELRRHGYGVSPGTLYPILHGLQKAGYLRCREEAASGKLRKYYTATAKGRRMLGVLRRKIREVVGEVLDDEASSRPKTG